MIEDLLKKALKSKSKLNTKFLIESVRAALAYKDFSAGNSRVKPKGSVGRCSEKKSANVGAKC